MKRDHTMRPHDLTATQPISQDVLAEKYLKAGETGAEDLYRRVARALASVEKEELRAEWEQRSWPTCTPVPSAPGAS
jgi:ribonucleoside-diphosphate reductase alpha chain